jgi:C-terminal processing protease CtpA/Prc
MRGSRASGAGLALALALAGCGGGSGDAAPAPAAACDSAAQTSWLHDYMAEWYYWSGSAPLPDPAAYDGVGTYFEALRYAGDGAVPRDRWSYIESTAAFSQFFAEGRTMGYGLFVNGIEQALPLKVRYVEPLSPAARAGLKRGDIIQALNGRGADELVAQNDYSALSPLQEGEELDVQVAEGSGSRTVTLVSAIYDLQPVSAVRVLALPDGTKAGYVLLKDFITQAEAPLADAFTQMRAAGATELIIDLRYNGGGRVSTAAALASLASGAAHPGGVFAQLHYNARHPGSDSRFALSDGPAPAYPRVVVLTGARTCSASELVVNGLKPFADVATIGGVTCGKPFGFNPVASCGNTYSAVTFESFNALGQGRYYDGIAPTCSVAEDFGGELGDAGEKLTAAALSFLQTGTCPASAGSAAAPRRKAVEPGDRRGMVAD